MEINEKAPGNISQQAVTRGTDNETGHDPRRDEDNIPLPPEDEALRLLVPLVSFTSLWL